MGARRAIMGDLATREVRFLPSLAVRLTIDSFSQFPAFQASLHLITAPSTCTQNLSTPSGVIRYHLKPPEMQFPSGYNNLSSKMMAGMQDGRTFVQLKSNDGTV